MMSIKNYQGILKAMLDPLYDEELRCGWFDYDGEQLRVRRNRTAFSLT